jgi:putative oxidoreductase
MTALVRLYAAAIDRIERFAGDWLLGLAARFAFASVLLGYFLNSVSTKVGSGFPGLLVPQSGAYAQILPNIAEGVSYDVSQISLFPWKLIVYAGTYAEFLLPLLIVAGLATRLAALAMIGFITVMSAVDIFFHGIDGKAIGALFDSMPDALIADQRLLWLLPLLVLIVRGPGMASLDGLIARFRPGYRF